MASHATEDPSAISEEEQPTAALNDTKASLEKIRRQLSSSGRFLLQGSLLKRSETLRKWNQRWFSLDPTTGKMEYRLQRGDLLPKGLIDFDANSTITVSPLNFQGLKKYDGCCLYIGTPQKKEYFLCTETPGAARAWVSTLRAAQLVLKAHKEAVNSLTGNGSSKLGTVAAVVAAANASARESAKEIEAAAQMSIKAALKLNSPQENDRIMDDSSILKETLRVKDEELHQLARDLRARDSTIKEMADRLSDTAEAAEAAATAAHIMDKERKAAKAEIVRLQREMNNKLRLATIEVLAQKEKMASLEEVRDEALKEAHTWRIELGKARERAVVMEAALVRAEESAKVAVADARVKIQASLEREAAAIAAREEALKQVEQLRTQLNSVRMSEAVYISPRDEENAAHQSLNSSDQANTINAVWPSSSLKGGHADVNEGFHYTADANVSLNDIGSQPVEKGVAIPVIHGSRLAGGHYDQQIVRVDGEEQVITNRDFPVPEIPEEVKFENNEGVTSDVLQSDGCTDIKHVQDGTN